jgi:hypothetical protein
MSEIGRQKQYLWIAAAFVAGVFVVALVTVELHHRRFHPANHSEIRPGMALEQVEDLLGGPPGDYGRLWFGSAESMSHEGVNVPPGSRELVWFDDNHRIEVHFDWQDRVVAVHQRARWERRLWQPSEKSFPRAFK